MIFIKKSACALMTVLFVFSLAAADQGNDKTKKMAAASLSLAPLQKLDPGLRRLYEAYNYLGIKKHQDKRLSFEQFQKILAKSDSRRGALLQYYKMTNVAERKANIKGKEYKLLEKRRGNPPPTLADLVDPVIQKRWGNPGFDVVRGIVTSRNDPRQLESSHLKIRQTFRRGDSWKGSCEFPIFKAQEIAAQGDVLRLALMPVAQLDNDLSTRSTGAPRLRLGQPGNWTFGYTGKGVIVSNIDTGVDWSHGDFLDAEGHTRILYIWDTDVTTAGKTPEELFGMTGFNYGTVWTREEIDAGLCTTFDTEAHGTHTMGTIAGNGGATGNYTGMAPNADIIAVKGLDPYGDEFVFEMAKRTGQPATANNSWGSNPFTWGCYAGYWYYYPGDGSDDLSYYWDGLTAAYPTGAVMTKSAGNNGMWHTYTDHNDYGFALYDGSWHFGGTSRAGNALEHVFNAKDHEAGYWKFQEYTDMMIRSNVPVKVTVWVDDTHSFVMESGTYGEIDKANVFSSLTSYDLTGVDLYNGEYGGVMWFDSLPFMGLLEPGFPVGDWKITVEPLNSGDTANYDVWVYPYHMWVVPIGEELWIYNYYDSCFTTNSSHDEYQLDYSACKSVITTSAWTTRSEYQAADGNTYYPWGFMEPWLNTMVYFSSPGPSRDGRLKPDVAAPGATIISSASATGGWAQSELDPDLQHGWMWGTSMAAPHVAGGAALILQKYPALTFGQVLQKIQNWAKNDSFTAAIGPNGFGAGKLNLLPLNMMPVAEVTVNPEEIVLDSANNQTATDTQQAIFDGSGSYDPEKFWLSYNWNLSARPAGSNPAFTSDGNRATLVPDPEVAGTYQVSLVVNDGIYDSYPAAASVITKFPPPIVTVISPNGGQSWELGSEQPITWTYSHFSGAIDVILLQNNQVVGTIAQGVDVALGTLNWKVGDFTGGRSEPGSGYTIRIQHSSGVPSDDSDAAFTILPGPPLPPSAFAVQRLENDLIFSKEYINRLSWQANSANTATIASYRLYRKDKGAADSAYTLLQQLGATVMSYEERGLQQSQLYTYKITSVSDKGRESDPVVAGN